MSADKNIHDILDAEKQRLFKKFQEERDAKNEFSSNIKKIIYDSKAKLVTDLIRFFTINFTSKVNKAETQLADYKKEAEIRETKLKEEIKKLKDADFSEEIAAAEKRGIEKGFLMTFAVIGIVSTILFASKYFF